MGINSFIFIGVILSLWFLTYKPINEKVVHNSGKNFLIKFIDSTMYEISDKKVEKMVVSREAIIYKNKEELYDASVMIRSKPQEDGNDINIITAKSIVKKGTILDASGDVLLNLSNGTSITTQKLHYDTKKELLTNNMPYEILYQEHKFNGKDLYFDMKNTHIKSNNIKFNIKVENEKIN